MCSYSTGYCVFLLNICEQTSGHVFIYKANERPLLLRFGAHLLILILF